MFKVTEPSENIVLLEYGEKVNQKIAACRLIYSHARYKKWVSWNAIGLRHFAINSPPQEVLLLSKG